MNFLVSNSFLEVSDLLYTYSDIGDEATGLTESLISYNEPLIPNASFLIPLSL